MSMFKQILCDLVYQKWTIQYIAAIMILVLARNISKVSGSKLLYFHDKWHRSSPNDIIWRQMASFVAK